MDIESIRIEDLLTLDRIDITCTVSSKKRLMEHMAYLLSKGSSVDEQTIFKVLIERERLGSTGIGNHVALPHGRLSEIDKPRMALAIHREGLDYQSQDGKLVKLVIGLVVPEHANETHLQILAQLAKLFSQTSLCEDLLAADEEAQVFEMLTNTSLT